MQAQDGISGRRAQSPESGGRGTHCALGVSCESSHGQTSFQADYPGGWPAVWLEQTVFKTPFLGYLLISAVYRNGFRKDERIVPAACRG